MRNGNIFSSDGERTVEEGRTEKKRDCRREKGGSGNGEERNGEEETEGRTGCATKGGKGEEEENGGGAEGK